MGRYIASLYQIDTYGEGWVDYPIAAASLSEAEQKAAARFAGTTGSWTLRIEDERHVTQYLQAAE